MEAKLMLFDNPLLTFVEAAIAAAANAPVLAAFVRSLWTSEDTQ
jgi:hypothetical protein